MRWLQAWARLRGGALALAGDQTTRSAHRSVGGTGFASVPGMTAIGGVGSGGKPSVTPCNRQKGHSPWMAMSGPGWPGVRSGLAGRADAAAAASATVTHFALEALHTWVHVTGTWRWAASQCDTAGARAPHSTAHMASHASRRRWPRFGTEFNTGRAPRGPGDRAKHRAQPGSPGRFNEQGGGGRPRGATVRPWRGAGSGLCDRRGACACRSPDMGCAHRLQEQAGGLV